MIEIHANMMITPRVNRLLEKFNLKSGGKVQQVIDNAIIAYDEDYCPWDTGYLAASPRGVTVIGSGLITYPGPYAHYQYYGEVYGPNIWNEDQHIKDAPSPYFSPAGQKKYPTGRELQYDTSTNALAGPYWFERMKADHVDDIVEEAQKAATGRKKRWFGR